MGYVEELRTIVGHRPLILPGAVVILLDEYDQILLQRRPEGRWGLPGGIMELGESIETTAKREVEEETGLQVSEMNLLGVFSGPEYYIKTPNGDEFYVVTVAFSSVDYSGELVASRESLELRFFNLTKLPQDIPRTHQTIINTFTNQRFPL